jgi:Uma2 family endonuclease
MNAHSRQIAAPLNADAFVDWATEQPRGKFELVDGEIVAMAPERAEHADAKFDLAVALRENIKKNRLSCRVYVDSLSVRINEHTVYQPDILVNCGDRVPRDSIWATNPVIVVEVVSPSSKLKDTSTKLADYFRVSSIQHYLVVDLRNQTLLHHQRENATTIKTAIAKDGLLRFDPPGITIDSGDIFQPFD